MDTDTANTANGQDKLCTTCGTQMQNDSCPQCKPENEAPAPAGEVVKEEGEAQQ